MVAYLCQVASADHTSLHDKRIVGAQSPPCVSRIFAMSADSRSDDDEVSIWQQRADELARDL